MDPGSWYGSEAGPYTPHQPPAAADSHIPNASLPPQPPPQQQQLSSGPSYQLPSSSSVQAAAAPTSAPCPYQPHDYPPNPGFNPGGGNPPPLYVSSDFYNPTASSALQPPGVQEPYAPYPGPNAHAAHYGYPMVYYHGPARDGTVVGDGGYQSLYAKEAIRQYGVDPVTYRNVPRPNLFMRRNGVTRPPYGIAKQKKKKNASKVVQSAYCEVCKVSCNTQEVLINHKQGKKHKKNLEKLKEVPRPTVPPPSAAEKNEASKTDKNTATRNPRTKRKAAPTADLDLETKKKKLLEEGTSEGSMRVCTVCNIVCNSEIVFNYHVAGQKHATMVKKQAVSAS